MKSIIAENPDELFWASFNSFELRIPGRAVSDIARPGDNADAVDYWKTRIERPDRCTVDALYHELREYGAWEEEELKDDTANWRRIVWCAAHNINEDDMPDCSDPVTE